MAAVDKLGVEVEMQEVEKFSLIEDAKTQRTHDKFYLSEDRNAPIKDSFRMIADHIEREFAQDLRGLHMADIGCAVGVFPNYISERFPDLKIVGCEYDNDLLAVAEISFPHIEFRQFDVTNPLSCVDDAFDIITLCGVLSIFDRGEEVIGNLLRWVRPGGKIFIFNMFNPNDLDVFIRYGHSDRLDRQLLESGWNIPSRATIKKFLNDQGYYDISFDPFEISLNLDRKPSDPVRSWTEQYMDGRRFITNGLCILQPNTLLTIRV